MPINEGQPAPDFRLTDQNGASHCLSELRGRPVVLWFYPKDMTTGCTLEAHEMHDLLPEFRRAGVEVFGVSILDEKSKKQFAEKEGVSCPLLADKRVDGENRPDPEVAKKYGVWTKKPGKDEAGVARTTFLIDGEGKIARRWDVEEVEGHAAEVLEAAKRLA
jgi:peroxiredoxin Q/BCP